MTCEEFDGGYNKCITAAKVWAAVDDVIKIELSTKEGKGQVLGFKDWAESTAYERDFDGNCLIGIFGKYSTVNKNLFELGFTYDADPIVTTVIGNKTELYGSKSNFPAVQWFKEGSRYPIREVEACVNGDKIPYIQFLGGDKDESTEMR